MDTVSKEARSQNMRAIRSTSTKLETEICRQLWKKGIRFRKNVKNLYGKPDIAIKKYKIVIFLDSCFWHGCPVHYRIPKSNEEYWYKKIHRNIDRDKEVNEYYYQNRWHLLRVWEHEIKNDVDEVVSRIVAFIQSYRN